MSSTATSQNPINNRCIEPYPKHFLLHSDVRHKSDATSVSSGQTADFQKYTVVKLFKMIM